ncbi:hypothetical protein Tco_0831889, partial [Tanacetum coccineum]
WTVDPPFSQSSKSSPDARYKYLGDDEKKVTKEPCKEGDDSSKDSECSDQENEDDVNSTNNVNVASTNEVNAVGENTSIELPDDPNMHELEDIVYSDDNEDVSAEADMNNLDAFMPVSPIPTTRVHKDHPVEQIIGDLNSAPQTRRMTKNLEEHGSKLDRGYAGRASTIEAIRSLDFSGDLLNGKRALGTKCALKEPDFPDSSIQRRKGHLYRCIKLPELGLKLKQKKDGIFISQDKYVTEILKKFGFTDVKTASTPMETQKILLKDEDGEEVDVYLYL